MITLTTVSSGVWVRKNGSMLDTDMKIQSDKEYFSLFTLTITGDVPTEFLPYLEWSIEVDENAPNYWNYAFVFKLYQCDETTFKSGNKNEYLIHEFEDWSSGEFNHYYTINKEEQYVATFEEFVYESGYLDIHAKITLFYWNKAKTSTTEGISSFGIVFVPLSLVLITIKKKISDRGRRY